MGLQVKRNGRRRNSRQRRKQPTAGNNITAYSSHTCPTAGERTTQERRNLHETRRLGQGGQSEPEPAGDIAGSAHVPAESNEPVIRQSTSCSTYLRPKHSVRSFELAVEVLQTSPQAGQGRVKTAEIDHAFPNVIHDFDRLHDITTKELFKLDLFPNQRWCRSCKEARCSQ